MIITNTPYRVSFFGGGTDYHAWYQNHGGAVLSTSIDHYCTIMCSYRAPFFEKKHRIVWREVEEVSEISEIKHNAVRGVLSYLEMDKGIEIMHKGGLPSRSGLGSSSSFTVGLINAIYGLKGQVSSKHNLAAEAVYVEREVLKENVGVQDQIAASYGGLNKIIINADGSFNVNPLLISKERSKEFNNNLMLFFTGISRTASDFAKNKIKNIPNKVLELSEIRKQVDIAENILCSNQELDDFGRLLHETWLIKRSLSNGITSDFIDEIYDLARLNGALGGKLLGAGGGGFILFYVKPENQPSVLKALSGLLWVPFQFDYHGSHIVHYNPTEFSQESLVRRDFAHLECDNIKNLKEFMNRHSGDKNSNRITKFNLIK